MIKRKRAIVISSWMTISILFLSIPRGLPRNKGPGLALGLMPVIAAYSWH